MRPPTDTFPRHFPLVCALACMAGSLSGCFLVGLSDDLGQASCDLSDAENPDVDCAELEATDDDPCMAWQCEMDESRGGTYCTYDRLDADNDKALASTGIDSDGEEVSCALEGDEVFDCDDTDADRAPGLAESCDGVDNDCDSRVDEGTLVSSSSSAVLFDDDVTEVDFATHDEAGTLAVVYASSAGGLPGASLVGVSSTQAGGETQASLRVTDAQGTEPLGDNLSAIARHLAVATMGTEHFAVAYFDVSGRQRLVAGLIPRAQSASTRISMDADVYRWGLSCDSSEACASNAMMPDVSVAHPKTARLSLATMDQNVLLAYQRQPADAPECGKLPAEGDEPVVMVNLLIKPRTREVLIERSPAPLILGSSREVDPPSVIALPAALWDDDDPETPPQPAAFMLAMTQYEGDGDIVVHHIQKGDDGMAVDMGVAIRVTGDLIGQPAIALSDVKDRAAVLIVAYRSGCLLESAIQAQLFSIRTTDDTLAVEQLSGPFEISDTNTSQRPEVTYASGPQLWGVTYRSPKGVHARLVEPDGHVRAKQSYVLIPDVTDDGEGDRRSFLDTPSIFPLEFSDDSFQWFGVASLVKAGDSYSVDLALLNSCDPQ